MYRVILVDDQPIFRDIIRGVLQRTGRFQFIGEASDGAEAVKMYEELRPDLVIMDVQMAPVNGFEATVRITESNPGASVILTSMSSDSGYARVAEQSGAIGFIPKKGLDASSVLSLIEEPHGYYMDQAA
jgi:two-component system response regulator DegU